MSTLSAPSSRDIGAPYSLAGATPGRAPAIQISGLTKRFATRGSVADLLRRRARSVSTVVDQVSFDVDAGEVFGVLGPNGAGKTTLFKMLATTILADAGSATVCGADVREQPSAVRRLVAAVSSDERSLNWRLSARENLLLFAALHRVPRAAVAGRVDAVLATVGLESAEHRMVATFSSGMRQRLLIARALLAEPRVLLLDEPTRALDPISAQELRAFLRTELVERQRCTIVLATHNTDEALGFCDRVVVLNKGRVLATGSAAELAARFGEEHYRILTAEPGHRCFAQLESRGLIRRLGTDREQMPGWTLVQCAIAGDPSRSANVLRILHESGVDVARLERVEPSLADLIGRIIGASGAEGRHA